VAPQEDSFSSSIRRWFVGRWQRIFLIANEDNPYLKEPILTKEHSAQIEKLRGEIRDLERDLKEAQKGDDKNLPPEMLALVGESFANDEYTVKPFDEVRRESASCGRFRELKDDVAHFRDGEHCWQTRKGRTTEMRLVCGDKNGFVSAVEARTCEHSIVFTTPAMCADADVAAFANKTVAELRRMKAEIGL